MAKFFCNTIFGKIDANVLADIFELSLSKNGGDPRNASNLFEKMASARMSFENFNIKGVSVSNIKEQRKKIESRYPHDYLKQLEELKKISVADFNKIKSKFNLQDLVFIRSTGEEGTSIGLLVKIKDKPFILCNENFIPDKFPVRISNQRFELICSA